MNNILNEAHGLLSIGSITEICTAIFKNYDVEFCYLFGSYAKGIPTETSDVDLLVSTNISGKQFYELIETLREELHKKVDLLDLNQLTNNQQLIHEILKDGIRIYQQKSFLPNSCSREAFELFKSEVCHEVHRLGDLSYLKKTIEKREVEFLYCQGLYIEALYTLGMIDFLCRVNGLPLVAEYDEYRKKKLSSPVYPKDVLLMATVMDDDSFLEKCVEESIPEFSRFNILESNVESDV